MKCLVNPCPGHCSTLGIVSGTVSLPLNGCAQGSSSLQRGNRSAYQWWPNCILGDGGIFGDNVGLLDKKNEN